MTIWELPEKVSELMSRRVVTVGPDVDLAFAMQLMLWSGVRHLPVLDQGELVGILSDRDFLPANGDLTMKQFLQRSVRETMSHPVQTIHPDSDAAGASAQMATAHINCLPVVGDDGNLAGILTSSDILAERGRLVFKGTRSNVPTVGARSGS